LKFKGNYKNGEQDGPWESFDEEGNPIKTEKYKDGILQESDSTIKNIVSNLSKFIDESNKLKKFFPFLKFPPLVESTRGGNFKNGKNFFSLFDSSINFERLLTMFLMVESDS
jgi:hypothetical protein